MWISNLPPFIPFYLAALVVGFLPHRARQALMLLVPIWGGLNLWFAFEPKLRLGHVDEYPLQYASKPGVGQPVVEQ